MDTKELLKKVRKIEIKTRRLSDHVFGGEYHSTFKGRGMTFSEVRQYQFGDDVRAIDWNVTARYNEPFVKVFEEERELTLMLVVDVSGSEFFGTTQQFKRDVLTEIAATLSFSALQNNDIAQNNLAYMYKIGGGVEKDMVKSLAWRILAAQSGNEKGRVFREIDAKEMTPALIEEAEELAERLLKK